MDVYKFLNMQKRKNAVQLVKHYSEVPSSKKVFPMIVQVKDDGVYFLLVTINGEMQAFGRSGLPYTNIDYSVFTGVEDGILIGELQNSSCSLEFLSGIVNTNRVKPLSSGQVNINKLSYVRFHDILTIDEFIKGASENKYNKRRRLLYNKYSKVLHLSGGVNAYSEKELIQVSDRFIELGYEGVVAKQNSIWSAGHKGSHMMKIVRGIHLDLLCVGAETGNGKFKGIVAKLHFQMRNRNTDVVEVITCGCGKGWGAYALKQLWDMYISDCVFTPIGKVFHVSALQFSSKGVLRLGKFGEMRNDKEAEL